MSERSIQASQFKAQCLGLLDEVHRDHISIVVTKHGRPIARVVPLADEVRSTTGSVRLLAREDAAYYSTTDEWEAEEHRR